MTLRRSERDTVDKKVPMMAHGSHVSHVIAALLQLCLSFQPLSSEACPSSVLRLGLIFLEVVLCPLAFVT